MMKNDSGMNSSPLKIKPAAGTENYGQTRSALVNKGKQGALMRGPKSTQRQNPDIRLRGRPRASRGR